MMRLGRSVTRRREAGPTNPENMPPAEGGSYRQWIAPRGGSMISDFPLPLFGYLLADRSGAAFLLGTRGRFLPLFTSLENAIEYAQRSNNLQVAIIELSTPEVVLEFIERPPSLRSPNHTYTDHDYRIVIDPISPDAGEFIVYERSELIQAWRTAIE
jgi:hypothetical protein